jgi:hypothetical protein
LFIFSSGANSQHAEGIEVTSEGLPIMSIAELWPDIDKLDEINHGGVSAINIPEVMLREKKSWTSVEKTNKPARCRGKGALLNDAPGPSNILPKGRGKSSMKRKAAQILFGAPGAISPRMRRLFADRQYSPSISMGLSECEIILESLLVWVTL